MEAKTLSKYLPYDNYYAIVILPLAATLLVALGIWLSYAPIAAVGILIILAAIVTLVFSPHQVMLGAGVFIIFRNYLVFQFGQDSQIRALVSGADKAIILILFIYLFIKSVLDKKQVWEKTPIDLPLICLIIISIVSSALAHLIPVKYALMDFFIFINQFLIFYAFVFVALKDNQLYKLTKVFFCVGVFIFIIGLIDLAIPFQFRALINNLTSVEYRFGITSVQSIFVHPGEYGWWSAYLCCFCLAFSLIFPKKILYKVFFYIFFIGALLSMRRKPVMAIFIVYFIGSLFHMLYLPKNQTINRIRWVAEIIFILIIVGVSFGDKIISNITTGWTIYAQAADPLKIARNALYYGAYEIAKDYPFGSGLGTFGGWISALNYSPLYYEYGLNKVYGLEQGHGNFICDTFWPYILAQFGWLGLFCYLWIFFKLLQIAWQGIKILDSPFEKAFALGTLLILIESFIESVAYPVYLKNPSIYFIFGSCGITCALIKAKLKSLDRICPVVIAGVYQDPKNKDLEPYD